MLCSWCFQREYVAFQSESLRDSHSSIQVCSVRGNYFLIPEERVLAIPIIWPLSVIIGINIDKPIRLLSRLLAGRFSSFPESAGSQIHRSGMRPHKDARFHRQRAFWQECFRFVCPIICTIFFDDILFTITTKMEMPFLPGGWLFPDPCYNLRR